MTPHPLSTDGRLVAFLLARAIRALRSDRLEKCLVFIERAHAIVEALDLSAERKNACVLIECLAMAAYERQLAIETAATWAKRRGALRLVPAVG